MIQFISSPLHTRAAYPFGGWQYLAVILLCKKGTDTPSYSISQQQNGDKVNFSL